MATKIIRMNAEFVRASRGNQQGGTGRWKDGVRLGEELFVEGKCRERMNSGDSGARRREGERNGRRGLRWDFVGV